jgi:hypothetical protein
VLIYVCISAHGFGHGSRVAAVLAALHQLEPSWRFVLSTSLPEWFLSLAFADVPCEHRICRWDVGVVQADALGADHAATVAALEQLECLLNDQLEQERSWLMAQQQPLLLLADVPPAAARLAAIVKAPLVWMGNFGWDAIYRPMGGALETWADKALAAYRQGTALIAFPFAMVMPWDVPTTSVGLTACSARYSPDVLRRRFDLHKPRQQIVLVGFGGLGLQLDSRLFDRWPHHLFLVSDPALCGKAANVRVLPPELRPLELMPLCERIITKPGFSTFCEALTAGVGIHLVRRHGFAEAPVLEAALQQHGFHRLLNREQLECGDWQLDQPLQPPQQGPLPTGGAQQAAALVRTHALAKRTSAVDG